MLAFKKAQVSISTTHNLIFQVYLYRFNGKISIERKMPEELRKGLTFK